MGNYANVGGGKTGRGVSCKMVGAYSGGTGLRRSTVTQLFHVRAGPVGNINGTVCYSGVGEGCRIDRAATWVARRGKMIALARLSHVEYNINCAGLVRMMYRTAGSSLIEVKPENREKLEAAVAEYHGMVVAG